jgi:hypothetical protein
MKSRPNGRLFSFMPSVDGWAGEQAFFFNFIGRSVHATSKTRNFQLIIVPLPSLITLNLFVMVKFITKTVCMAIIVVLCIGSLNAQFRGNDSELIYSTAPTAISGVFKTTVGGYDQQGEQLAEISLSYQAMVEVEGTIYVVTCDPNTNDNTFGMLDPDTGVFTQIASGSNVPNAASMAWDPTTDEVYVAQWDDSGSSPFGKINLTNGTFTSYANLPGIFLIAIDNAGVCYGLSMGFTEAFGTINLSNGEFTQISTYGSMNWNQDIGIDFETDILYHAYRDGTSGKPTKWRTINKTTGIPTDIGDFLPGRFVESFVIRSEVGLSDKCPKVANVTANQYESNKVQVSWTAPSDVTGLTHYKIYLNGLGTTTVDAETTTWISDPLTSGTYIFAVAAVYDEECAPVRVSAAPVEITTCGGAVSNVQVEYDGDDCTKATVTWEAPLKEKDYTAYGHNIYGNPAGYVSFDVNTPNNQTSLAGNLGVFGGDCVDGILYAYNEYGTFKMIESETGAVLENIYGAWSDFMSDMAYDYSTGTMYGTKDGVLYTINLINGVPTFVANLTGFTGYSLVTLAVDLAGNMYGIEQNSTGAGFYSINKTTGACTLIGLTGKNANYPQSMGFDHDDGTLYWCQNSGIGDMNFMTVNTSTGVATAIANNTNKQTMCFHLPYNPGSSPTVTYNVYRDDVQIASEIEETAFEDTDFETTQAHKWSVAVICKSDGESEWISVEKDACSELPPPCNSATNLNVEISSDACVATLTWSAAPDMPDAKYNVYRDGTKIANDVTGTTYVDEDIETGIEYIWVVKTICVEGEADGVEAKGECMENINELSNSVSIYPNPTDGQLQITNYELRIENVEIFDVLGKKVQSLTFNVQSSETRNPKPEKFPSFGGAGVVINISNLPSGIYFIRIQTEKGKIVTQKVVKQ